jgi:hypothetical protein
MHYLISGMYCVCVRACVCDIHSERVARPPITCHSTFNNTEIAEWLCMKFHIGEFYCNLPTHSSFG